MSDGIRSWSGHFSSWCGCDCLGACHVDAVAQARRTRSRPWREHIAPYNASDVPVSLGAQERDLKAVLQGLHEELLDTIAACGDVARGVMCSVNPRTSVLHASVYALSKQVSDHVIPRIRAYHEFRYGEQRIASSNSEEPFYGATYMPRKFKIGFAVRQ